MTLRYPTSRLVLIDTSAYFPRLVPTEARHDEAEQVQRRLVVERWQKFTTNFVVAVLHALVLSRYNRRLAAAVLSIVDRSADAGQLDIVRIERDDEARAREIIRQYDDKDFSLTDATSFAVMERLNIQAAFTFDRNFAQYGLDVLSPRP